LQQVILETEKLLMNLKKQLKHTHKYSLSDGLPGRPMLSKTIKVGA